MAIIDEGRYPFDPVVVARVVRVTLEGLWFDLMTSAEPYPVDAALAGMFQLAMAFFPKHFGKSGVLAD